MKKAVFLDRDGCINPLIFNEVTERYEAPHYPDAFDILPNVKEALMMLKELGFLIIMISNQPDYALGKATYDNVIAIIDLTKEFSQTNGNLIDEFYYCFHHPNAKIKEFAVKCNCKKPGNEFLKKAIQKYNLNVEKCFFIGDQDTDVLCGHSLGIKTVQIINIDSRNKKSTVMSDYYAQNLYEASCIIASQDKNTQMKNANQFRSCNKHTF